ncbi:MAG TPA: carboxypeptidase regulatory-like domain-containing protein [Bryobacteraceae bacterium]|nr:carboxypeptidase regulatory-like domain-containing protein [Bryobacteraceae bacterium]
MPYRLFHVATVPASFWLAIFCAANLAAQSLPGSAPAPDATMEPASVEGVVLSAATGQPLKRAQVALEPATPGEPAFAQACDDNGHFLFPKIPPGRYSIAAQRDRYLPAGSAIADGQRLPPVFMLFPGQHMRQVVLRMRVWGVLAGKVRFGDAEPATGVTIRAWRVYFHEGRRGYTLAASTQTNDLGEYRIYGLPPGYYMAAAIYAARRMFTNAKVVPTPGAPQNIGYPMTFYPSATRLSDAVPIHIGYGDEIGGNDIYLDSEPLQSIGGRVISGLSGLPLRGPAIQLQLADGSGNTGVTSAASVTVDAAGRFEISGIPSGAYEIVASAEDGSSHLIARRTLTVADAPDDSLELMAQPVAVWDGHLKINTNLNVEQDALRVEMAPRDASAPIATAEVGENGAFKIELQPGLTYDAYLRNAPAGFYIDSVRVGNVERLNSGVRIDGGARAADLQIELAEGARVSGRVAIDGESAASGAQVALIPDPPDGRYQSFATAVADAYGGFDFDGVAPGRYIVTAWADHPPCDIYNPQSIPACGKVGTTVNVTGRGDYNVQLPLYSSNQ